MQLIRAKFAAVLRPNASVVKLRKRKLRGVICARPAFRDLLVHVLD